MDDKLLEQVGHFIGQTRAEVLALTDHRIDEAADFLKTLMTGNGQVLESKIEASAESLIKVIDTSIDHQEKQIEAAKADVIERMGGQLTSALDLLREDTEEKRRSAFAAVEELNNSLIDEMNDTLKAQTAQHVEQIGALTEQIKAQEVFEAQLTQRIAEIKDGEQGVQGNDGEDGLDRPILEPVELVAQKDYPKSTVGTHNGGLWIATKQSVGSPADDPQAWHCMLDAMSTMSIDLLEDRRFKLSVRMSSGELIDDTFDIPYPEHKGIWEEGSYVKGDIVTKGSSMWLAQQDTDGQPPGNGWQQILSAPRGKQGPAGKSIEGPQGKPGRNGMDAILPANFIDDVIALASERKAFEDGRSAAEAITSFRGYFVPDETYRSGDVVNDLGGLFLCVSGGQFTSIAQGQTSWELMFSAPKSGSTPQMRWRTPYSPADEVSTNDVVLDDGWLMIANKATSDPAAPSRIGATFDVYQGTMAEDNQLASQIVFGNRYTLGDTGFIDGYRVYIVTGNSYRVFSVVDPLGTPRLNELNTFTAESTGWVRFSITPIFVTPGAVFDLVSVVQEPDPTPTVVLANYNYQTPQNPITPVAGDIQHSRGQPDVMSVSYTDSDTTDRTALIQSLSVGDIIDGAGQRWAVQANADQGTYANISVTPALVGAPTGTQQFGFETVTPTPITYAYDTDYWSINNISAEGLLGVDEAYPDIVPNDTAYGTDINVQAAIVSLDWDFMSSTSTVGSGGQNGGGTTRGFAGQIVSENVLVADDFTDQNPTGLGVTHQILFGNAVTTEFWDMDAAGAATCLLDGSYTLRLRTVIGREGAVGESQIYQRALINGTQFGNSSQIIIDNDRIEVPAFYNQTVTFTAGDVLTFEIIRDADGDNSGGLRAGTPNVVGWNPSPSASMSITRTYIS